MPCRDYSDDQISRETQKRLDHVTKLLCYVMSHVGHSELGKHLQTKDKDLKIWWEEHQEQDRKREEAERRASEKRRLKREALSKLSKEERKALGLE
jgi:hypothetical protein